MKKLLIILIVALSATTFAQTPELPGGSGTEGDPYQIATLNNLVWISQTQASWVNGTYFIQTADIDASASSAWPGGEGFSPIGIATATESFKGNYNGSGYAISNLFINRPASGLMGLFGVVDNSNTIIQNLGLINLDITGKYTSGGLVAQANNGSINNCYTTGTITGTYQVGGFVGVTYSSFTINNCYSRVNTSATHSLGRVGGFIGYNINSPTSNCYSTGSVNGTSNVGGFIGYSPYGLSNTTGSYWDTETSGQASSAGGTGIITNDMKTEGTFTGWDFSSIWAIDSGINDGYPYLQQPPGPTTTWDGSEGSVWNTAGNWDGGIVPTSSDDVIIANAGTAPIIGFGVQADCNNITINSGATLTLQDGGSLITAGTITNNGIFTAEKMLTSDSKWHLISVPNTNETSFSFLGDYLQYWNEATGLYDQFGVDEVGLDIMKGYSFWGTHTNKTYTFTGTPITGNQSIGITASGVGDYTGANLLGNPYPSSIDWDLVIGYGAVYYWDGGAYVAYPADTPIPGGGTYGTGSQYIAPMQGFFIVAGGADTFTLTNAMRTHSGASSFYKSNKNSLSNGILLQASNGSYKDQLLIRLFENTSADFEQQYDAWKFPSNTNGLSQLWSLCPDGNLSIDVRPYQEVIHLGFSNDQAGNYSIGIKEIADINSAEIEDTKLNTFHNLANGAYSFDWNTTDSEERFILHLKATGLDDYATSNTQIFAHQKTIHIRSSEKLNQTQIRIIDMMGRLVYEQNLVDGQNESVNVPLEEGVYIVQLVSDNGTQVEKVILK